LINQKILLKLLLLLFRTPKKLTRVAFLDQSYKMPKPRRGL
jgi:hypothetical protein